MSKLRVLSGEDVIKILERFGFVIAAGKGSHVKMKRILKDGYKQTLTIPKHNELDKGTLKAIFNQALRYIPESELRGFFYSDN